MAGGCWLVGVVDAQATTDIENRNVVAQATQFGGQVGKTAKGLLERPDLRKLGANVHIDALHPDTREFRGARVGLVCPGPRDAEFVAGLAGRDFCVRPGIDIRVDAECDGGLFAFGYGDLAEEFQFRFGFDVELVNILLQREAHFARGFGDTGVNDFCGGYPGQQGASELTFRDHVGARAHCAQRPDDGLVGVGLDCKTHERIVRFELFGIGAVILPQRCCRIAINRCLQLLGDLVDRHVFGVKSPFTIVWKHHGFDLVCGGKNNILL